MAQLKLFMDSAFGAKIKEVTLLDSAGEVNHVVADYETHNNVDVVITSANAAGWMQFLLRKDGYSYEYNPSWGIPKPPTGYTSELYDHLDGGVCAICLVYHLHVATSTSPPLALTKNLPPLIIRVGPTRLYFGAHRTHCEKEHKGGSPLLKLFNDGNQGTAWKTLYELHANKGESVKKVNSVCAILGFEAVSKISKVRF
jgi:hypothetical protein